MRIAVDIGFGFVKVKNDRGKEESFPSVMVKRNEKTLRGIVGGAGDDYSIIYWEEGANGRENEKKCFIGDAAITNGGTRMWEDKSSEINLDELKVFISTAIALVNPENEDVDLCVGLPMSYYIQKKEELKSSLEKINSKVAITGKNYVGQAKINSVFVFPQGAGAYYAAVFDTEGQIKDYNLATTSVGIIDIGYRTVDFLVMAKGRKGISIVDHLSDSLEEDGMNRAYIGIQSALSMPKSEGGVGSEIALKEIEKAILWFGGKLTYRRETVLLTELEEDAYKERADVIASKIKMKWGTEADLLEYIFITGGGGEQLYPFLKDKFEQAELQPNSSFANCEGYLGAQAKAMKK